MPVTTIDGPSIAVQIAGMPAFRSMATIIAPNTMFMTAANQTNTR